MTDYLLYQTPGSCSRVALNALEEIGLPYREKGVDLMRGEHYGPAFQILNPKRKVPVLVADDVVITELPVILYHLANAHPAAGLLPNDGCGRVMPSTLSDLIWLAGTLHPLANRVFRPGAISTTDAEGVKAGAMALLADHAAAMSARLAEAGWWYGKHWSMVDMFIEWIYGIAAQCGFEVAAFPVLCAHGQRVRARPSFENALERERQAVTRDGLSMPPGMTL